MSGGSRLHGRRLVTIGVTLVLALLIGALPAQGREKLPPVKVGDAHLLHRGSVFNGANGLFFGPGDRLYLASVGGGKLSVVDPRSGHVIERLGSEVGVLSPDDVTVAPDGTVYWTNILDGTVGKLSPDGSWKTQFVGYGVNPITVSDEGRLFVGLAFLGDGLLELDPGLTAPPQWVILPSSPPLGINGFDFGPDGMLYAPRMFTGEIVRIDVDAPVPQVVAGGFTFPTGVKFNSRGELHLVANGDVFKVDPATGARTVLLDTDGATDNLAFDSKDRLFVSMYGDNTVLEVLPSGGARLLNPPGVGNPGGVAVLPSPRGGEDVYVADSFSLDRIDGRTGRFSVAKAFPEVAPWSVNVDETGSRLILSGALAGVVQIFDPASGAVVAAFPAPLGINAVPFDGDIAIAQIGPGTVLDTAGNVLMSGMFLPAGMASDGENLYVSDWATGIIWWLPAGGVQVPIAFGFENPEGLELRDRELLVVDEGTRQLISLDLASGGRTVIAEELPVGRHDAAGAFVPPFGNLSDVAVGPSGDVYVTADNPNGVYVLRG